MSHTLSGLVLSLHAGLANGQSEGSNNPPLTYWRDISSFSNNGVLKNFNFTNEDGWGGNNTLSTPFALNFDGKNSYVDCGSAVVPTTDVTFEVSFLFKGKGVILDSGAYWNYPGISLFINKDDELIVSRNTSITRVSHNFGKIEKNKKYHIAAAYNHTNGTLRCFLNGAPKALRQVEYTSVGQLFTDRLYLGSSNHNEIGTFFAGSLYIVRVYNRVLTDYEVAQNYNGGNLVHKNKSDIYSHTLVPWRLEVPSNLQVGISSKVSVSYGIEKKAKSDISSSLIINQVNQLSSRLTIIPVYSFSTSYKIEPNSESDLTSSIGTTIGSNIWSRISVSTNSRISSRYNITNTPYDVLSSSVNVARFDSILGKIKVNVDGTGPAKYSISPINTNDLTSNLTVKESSNLQSSVTISFSNKFLRAKYEIDPIHITEINSSISISSVSQITSSVSISLNDRITAKYGITGLWFEELVSSLYVTPSVSIPASISVMPFVKLTATYVVEGLHFTDLNSSITVNKVVDLYSNIKIRPENTIRARYGVFPVYKFSIPSYLTIKEYKDIQGIIKVNPYNRVVANYSLVERPIFNMDLLPVKDAFVRSSVPKLSYGQEHQLMVGKDDKTGEQFRTFIEFDLSQLPQENTEVSKATLRLFFTGFRRNGTLKLLITEPDGPWRESDLTWDGQPYSSQKEGKYYVTYEVGDSVGYIDINVSDIAKEWFNQTKPNHGLVIGFVDEEGQFLKSFYSKEQIERPPLLSVDYYDKQVYSYGWSTISSKITARQLDYSDGLKGHLELINRNQNTNLTSHIHIMNERERESFILVSTPAKLSNLAVRRADDGDLDTHLAIRRWAEPPSDLLGYIEIRLSSLESEIKVPHSDNLISTISARQFGEKFLESSFLVSQTGYKGHLGVRVEESFDLLSSISTKLSSNTGSITILERSQFQGNITVRVSAKQDRLSDLTVPYHFDTFGTVLINKYLLPGFLGVSHFVDTLGSINLRVWGNSSLQSHVYILNRFDISSRVSVNPAYDVPSQIRIRSGNLRSKIIVPHNEEIDLTSNFQVRVWEYSSLSSSIYTNSGNLRSKLGVQLWDSHSINSSFFVRLIGMSDISSSIQVKAEGEDDLPGIISARKYRDRDWFSRFKVRVTDESELASSTWIRVWGDSSLDGLISVRRDATYDVSGHIAVRVRMHNDMFTAFVGVSHYSDFHGHLLVRPYSHMRVSYQPFITPGNNDLQGTVAVSSIYQVPSNLFISTQGHVKAKYNIIPSGQLDLEGHAFIRSISQIPSNVKVNTIEYPLRSQYSVTPVGWVDLASHAFVRSVSQLESAIKVNTQEYLSRVRYSFIYNDNFDVVSSISIKEVDDLTSTIAARVQRDNYIQGSMDVWQLSQIHSSIAVRRWGDPNDPRHNINGSISVWEKYTISSSISVWEKSLLTGHIAIRVWSDPNDPRHNLEGGITARQKDHSYIWSSIEVWDKLIVPGTMVVPYRVDLEAEIEVITAYPYAFIM